MSDNDNVVNLHGEDRRAYKEAKRNERRLRNVLLHDMMQLAKRPLPSHLNIYNEPLKGMCAAIIAYMDPVFNVPGTPLVVLDLATLMLKRVALTQLVLPREGHDEINAAIKDWGVEQLGMEIDDELAERLWARLNLCMVLESGRKKG